MTKHKITIQLDDIRYTDLRNTSREIGFGDTKTALSSFTHYIVVNSMFRYGKKSTGKVWPKGCIYFVQAGIDGPIKIGFTNRLSERLIALQTGCAYQLQVIAILENCTRTDEQYFHCLFSPQRMMGEWFDKRIKNSLEEEINRTYKERIGHAENYLPVVVSSENGEER